MATRVFELARELGIKSKAILERCKAEGVPGIDNHMTTVSAGLSASIRGWFSEAAASSGDSTEQDQGATSPSAVMVEKKVGARNSTTSTPVRKKPAKKLAKKAVAKKKTSSSAGSSAGRSHRPHPGERRSDTGPTRSPARRPAATSPSNEPTHADSKFATAKSDEVDSAPTHSTTHHGEDESTAAREPQTTFVDTVSESTESFADVGTFIDSTEEPSTEPSLVSPAAETTSSDPVGFVEETPVSSPSVSEIPEEPIAEGSITDPTQPASDGSIPNVPDRPNVVTPAGPQLDVQAPAKMRGPKVVRIEEAEVIDRPRPRPRPSGGGSFGGQGAGGPMHRTGGGDVGGGGAGAGAGGGGVSRRNLRRKNSRGVERGRSGQSGRYANSGGGGVTGKIKNWNQQDLIEREERLRGSRGLLRSLRRGGGGEIGERAKSARETGGVVKIQEPFSIKDLSAATGVKAADILLALMQKGKMANVNSGIEMELAMEIMMEYNIELEIEEKKSAEDVVAEQFHSRDRVDVGPRPPVVAILGHVDHGKTSLLDQIRNANVADGEAGGITQHTSAFRVNVHAGDADKQIVFLDTPGHEAFTAMRARGAQVTDIVVLVVAADDGVMPQTAESIAHAKAAGVPIVIVLNKIDKPEATEENIQRIYGQLAEHELSPTDWGGQTEVVRCSALKGEGIQDVLDTLDLQSEVMELSAAFGGPASGNVLEAKMIEGRGPVANILVREGTIKIGDFVAVGRAFGRVRDMKDDRGQQLEVAGPATPIEISGLDRIPDAGDSFYVVDTLKMAQQSAEQRVTFEREQQLAAPKVTLDNIFTTIDDSKRSDLNLIVKADAQGSVETLKKTLQDISTDEVNIRVLHAAVGGIVESDVILAEASGAIVLGFHVIASAKARNLAEQKQIEIRNYQVIYELLDDVRKAASGLLAPELREEVLGHAEVREVFKVSKVGLVAGCYATDGVIKRSAHIRVTRQDIVIEDRRVLEQLKRFKDDAKEVRAGQECGMKIEGYDDIKPGDILECFNVIEIAREI